MRDLEQNGSLSHAVLGAEDLVLVGYRGAEGDAPHRFLVEGWTEIVEIVPPPKGARFAFAVGRPFGEGRLAILGYLDQDAVQKAAGFTKSNGWLELRHGKAALRLHQDGRVRVSGDNVGIEADGSCFIDAAEIRLN